MNKAPKPRGRPPGTRAAQLELQKLIFEHPKMAEVVETVFRAALDDNHKNQAAAQKLLLDRAIPISACDRSPDFRQQVNIVVSGIKPDEKAINDL
ncbi:MAG: hypothetical protein VXW45_04415 [Pseudomonadota bacterium]|nr:hypothetical protein [Pseudomonadota bacterium]